jgi:glycerol-3-phosphate dehydrogenase
MAITLALTAVDHGACVANRVRVTGLLRAASGQLSGAEVVDEESGQAFPVSAKVVVNATGIFSDALRRLDDPEAEPMIEPAQGIHLVLDRSFGPSENAIMVPHTDDGRVLFVVPWHDRVLVGTTDTEMPRPELEPRALPEEVEFVLRNAARYMAKDPERGDVLSVFAGQRPLVHPGGAGVSSKSISRSHEVVVSPSGLVSILGGKWTTYRKMAEDVVQHAIPIGALPERPCVTEELRLHGWLARDDPALPTGSVQRAYGSDAARLAALCAERPELSEPLHPRLDYRGAEVVWAARHEMARTLEDALARRTRSLLLDARASIEAAPTAARLLADELGRAEAWARAQEQEYTALARGYLLDG